MVFLVPYIASVCLISALVIYVWLEKRTEKIKALHERIDLVEAHIKVLVAANPNIAFASDLPDETFYGPGSDEDNKGVSKDIESLFPGMYDNEADWTEVQRIKLRAEGG